jgi:DNA replication protein DnaC
MMAASQTTMDKLYGMRLSVMAQAYRDQEESPGIADMTFDERFAMIVDAEWDARRVNKRTRLLRQAGFSDPEANVADIRYDADRKLDKAKMVELSNCEWIRNHRNVIITGASGAGKSWIANALGVAACNAFFSVRYVRLPEMIDELTVDKDEEWLKMKKRYLKCDLLLLDDWLLEEVPGKGARELLEIIEGRLRSGSLLVCSQFSPAGWHKKLGEGAIADAVIDRIVYRSEIIHIEGDESMRKRIG